MKHIIVTMTSISSRVESLDAVVKSILAQKFTEVIEYEIFINLSNDGYLLDEGIKTIPDAMQRLSERFSNVRINWSDNIGPYRKLLPTLEYIISQDIEMNNLFIITADDDTLVPFDWAQTLVDKCVEFNCVIGYRGRQITLTDSKIEQYGNWLTKDSSLSNPSLLTVPTGKDGIIYRPNFFHPNVLNIKDALVYAGHADDLWFKTHTLVNNVPTCLIRTTLDVSFPVTTLKDAENLYDYINRKSGNDEVIRSLDTYCYEKFGSTMTNVLNSDGASLFNEKYFQSFQ